MDQKQLNNDINDSLNIFHKWANRGMIVGQIKEKYYTTRWHARLNTGFSLNDIFYPCHYYYRLPNWCRYIDDYLLTPVFGVLVCKWRVYCYRQAYHLVLTKYPNVDHCIDYDEVLDKNILNAYYKK